MTPLAPLYTQSGAGAEVAAQDGSSSIAAWSLTATIAFTLIVYTLEGSLDGRQKKAYQKTKFPVELETTVSKIDTETPRTASKKESSKDGDNDGDNDGDDKDKIKSTESLLKQLQAKFKNSQTYGLDKVNFGMIASAYDAFESIVFLIIGFLPFVWDKSVEIGQSFFGLTQENEIKITLIFLLLVTIVGTITSLPFELYSTFQIERKHGFNKQTYGLFFTDKIKSLILTFAIGGPFIALLLRIIQSGGQYFYLYVWAFMFVFSVFMMTIVPVFIMPLFNKYEPLAEGDLKTRIYQLADRLEYPLKKLFVMDGSKRSAHSNAFMFGFGSNKRIVLFDTLLEQVSDDEVLAILGHELGHWKLGHTLTNFAVTQFYFGAAFYFFSLCYTNRELYAAFGFDDESQPVPTVIALMLFFQTIWAPIDKILSFVLTVFSRHCEFAADKFSVDLDMSKELQSGLCKIHLENLGAMCPDPWYSSYHYSHPPLVERLSAMMKFDDKRK
uniref:CAAX prenyl protease n=1 Tax=Craspedostauros australis TaxID=1486917 RepID=A0A7R9X169_9STRA|mmetsp:Transcript_5517/g.14972  ORF Transcript_5517/g.14972 Transcript_5517/m.14972 type:complete len:498 (+) Transcript_5517:116-1609(+)